jgi:hypothetical protein
LDNSPTRNNNGLRDGDKGNNKERRRHITGLHAFVPTAFYFFVEAGATAAIVIAFFLEPWASIFFFDAEASSYSL